jgi:two-component system LytT family response regulator
VPKIKTILVDDEPSANVILASLLDRIDAGVDIVSKCENLEQAVVAIKKHQPDLVFLDIEMPNFAGYEITSFFDEVNFEIIFVTAYDHYAIKAFEIAAIDYILKPIEVDRLEEAVAKFKKKTAANTAQVNYQIMLETLETNSVNKIIIQSSNGQKVVQANEITCIEAGRSYCTIHTVDGNKYVQTKNLKHFESILTNLPNFFRCHKSWFINLHHLEFYSKSDLTLELISCKNVKLSKYKKVEFEDAIASL